QYGTDARGFSAHPSSVATGVPLRRKTSERRDSAMHAQDPEAMTLAAGRLHGVSAEEMFRLAVEACPSGMIMTDRSGAIVMLNTEIEVLFGYLRDELIGQSIETLVPKGSRGQHVGLREYFARIP